jgi:hypothetical protein
MGNGAGQWTLILQTTKGGRIQLTHKEWVPYVEFMGTTYKSARVTSSARTAWYNPIRTLAVEGVATA